MPKLKWAHCTAAGVDPVMKAIKETESLPSFLLTHHGGSKFSDVMAEYVLCQILNYERNMMLAWKSQQSKIWSEIHLFNKFRTLDHLTVGILGVGNMGSGIGKFLKSRGTKVLGYSRTPKVYGSKGTSFDRISADLCEILPECNYICNTLPDTPETCALLNGSILQMCTKKPVFINVGRGNIINQESLINALKNEWLSGAILDVVDEEPLPPSSKLWDIPSVVITPHIACFPVPDYIGEEFAKNYKRYIEFEELQYQVNWSLGY